MSDTDPLLVKVSNHHDKNPSPSNNDVRPGFESMHKYAGIKNYTMLRNRALKTVAVTTCLALLAFGIFELTRYIRRKDSITSFPSAMPTVKVISALEDTTPSPTTSGTPHPTTFEYWNDFVHQPTTVHYPTESPYFDASDNPLDIPYPTFTVKTTGNKVPWPTATGARATIPWPTATGARDSDDSSQNISNSTGV